MVSPNAERLRTERAIYSALLAITVGILAFTLPLEKLSILKEKERVLLPTDAVPTNYKILLAPHLDTFKFDGQETIALQVRTATSKILLHSTDIEVDAASVSVVSDNGASLKASSVTYPSKDTVLFQFDSEIPVGVAHLSLSFVGNLNDLMCGFYRSKYTVDGVQKWMATTQFEATDARRAFPCYDEPARKATFEVSLRIDETLSALGNMPVQSETKDAAFPGTKTISFALSPIMSTYLVAFVVGEFDYVETTTNHGVLMRVYTPPGKSEQGKFSLDVGSRTLDYFTDYFGIAYPLPKMDMIAIADFSAGAMENWGLVTYRETALLIDAEKSGISSKQRVAYVVAHELAHQWFGNLVTMEWWKELWLNEGFATFIGNQAVHVLFPEWGIWTQFVNDYVARAQDLDGLQSSHPIEVEVYSSAEINEIFDAISYAKGASVIRMVANFLGEKNFQQGLHIYLDRHKYGNAVTEDLWRALSEASQLDVSAFMDKWTKRVGYPLLQISSVEGSSTKFNVKQSRFLSSGAVVESDNWWNSVGFISSKSPETAFYVDVKEAEQTIEVPAEITEGADWIKANALQYGFFRTGYDDALLQKLVGAIRSNALSPIDRLTIQNDAFALSSAGKQSTAQALQIASAFANETDYTVWNGLITNLGLVSSVWAEESSYPRFQAFVRSLLRPVAQRLGWDAIPGESDRDALLRSLVISQLGLYKDEEIIAEGKKRFAEHLSGAKQIAVDQRFAVYRMVVLSGGEAEWETVKNIFETSDMNEERLRALRALGFTPNADLKIKTLEYTINHVRSQDVAFGVEAVASSSAEGRKIAWKFFQDNFATFQSKFGEGQFLLARIVGYVTGGFSSDSVADQIEDFFTSHPTPAADRTIKQSLESVRSNASWLQRDRQAVSAFLLGFDS